MIPYDSSVTSDMGHLKHIWKAVVTNTGKPYHNDPRQMAKWKGRTNSFEKVADRASQGETVEERSLQIFDSIEIDSSHHHLSESSWTSVWTQNPHQVT